MKPMAICPECGRQLRAVGLRSSEFTILEFPIHIDKQGALCPGSGFEVLRENLVNENDN